MGCETGKKEGNNWIVQEDSFSGRYLGKSETLMALGNGYLGIRSANEESYAGEKRNTFIAGTFNRFDENEVTELPNAADLIRMDIDLNGEAFDLKSGGEIIFYNKALNLKTGELKRQITWVSPNGHKYELVFRRFISRDNLHLIGQRVEIKPIDSETEIKIISGINGQMTNSGVQHFSEGEKRLFDSKYMQLAQTTTQSKIHFVYNTTHNFEMDSKTIEPKSLVIMGRRFIAVNFSCKVEKGKTLVIEKISNVHTSRDIDAKENADKEATKNISKEVCIEVDKKISKEDDVDIEVEKEADVAAGKKTDKEAAIEAEEKADKKIDKEASIEADKKALEELRSLSLSELKADARNRYDELLQKSADIWAKDWNLFDIRITGNNEFDQLAIRFAIYHLIIMTPAHDNRMNIAAKGLTGEGYKGHTFWDTEIFMLPFWTYSKPEVARSLLEYRYLSLPGAYKKARENGYKGAMFPWESAWLEDGEVTPEWGSADIVTGKPVKIWTGFIEQHISSDIAYAVWQYYSIAQDQDFMDKFGYKLIMEIAVFWASRLEWNESDQKYHINNVIGPDEYKEHVNNNAYTNYMASWTIQKAMEYYIELQKNRPELFSILINEIGLDEAYQMWADRVKKIYLPTPNSSSVIPQDDTYLKKDIIDLTRYKNQKHPGLIHRDLSVAEVNATQVSKQADVLLLLYLMENLFSKSVKKANWDYYEPKTLHDSSLSLSTHCVLASDLGEHKMAYDLFRQATYIDLGPNMLSSDEGIHAASLGGMWQCIVNGFGGVRMLDGKLRIEPHLPEQWSCLGFTIIWRKDRIKLTIDKNILLLKKETDNNPEIEIEVNGINYILKDNCSIAIS